VVRVEFMSFAPQTQEIVLKPETPAGKFDAEMILASRQQDQTAWGIWLRWLPLAAGSKAWPWIALFPLWPVAALAE